MLNIGPQELLIILVIALLVVGPQRLPELGRSIGRGLRELRKAQDEVKRTISVNLDDEQPNGSARSRSADRAAPGPAPEATSPPAASDTPPSASEALPASEVREISRSLGRSLSELRRAKEEVQRSFRTDVPGPAPKRTAPKRRTPRSAPSPSPAPADRIPEEDTAPDGPVAG